MIKLLDQAAGNYRFLTGIAPYSAGVIAKSGYRIDHVALQVPLPYRDGFALVDRHLDSLGRPRQALSAIELRSPMPFTVDGFLRFNESYRGLLESWDLLVGDHNPVARTNVAPVVDPPDEPSLYAFCYTVPCPKVPALNAVSTFVVSGGGETIGSGLGPDAIVRHGDTSVEAMLEKATQVMGIMQKRLDALQMTWDRITSVNVYTAHPVHTFLEAGLLAKMGPATSHGIHWFYSRPPVVDIEFEMDMRGILHELRL